MSTRKEIISKCWDKLHGNRVPLFYWDDGSHTEYYYDWINNLIRSENGFAVLIEADDSEITVQYLYDLILDLEWEIIKYYREHYGINLAIYD